MPQQTINTPRETTHQRIADALEDIVDKMVDTSSASNIDYDNTQSGLSANKVQGAVDELALAGFVTNTVNNLVNYYLKSETYNKTEVDSLIAAVKNSRFEAVSTLPTTDIKTNVIYLVPKSPTQTNNAKDEYINLDGTSSGWEKIGDTEIDLSGYVTTTALNTALSDYTTTTDLNTLLTGKVDKVAGKGLSTEDYTAEEKTKLAGIEAQANKTVVDSSMSTTSTNPLQNKIITAELAGTTTATGNPLTIKSAEANLVECKAEVEAVQEGSGDPSPTNVRPITGQTEVVIEDVGKNLWDEQWELGSIDGTTGEPVSNSNIIRSKNFNCCDGEKTYYCKAFSGANIHIYYYDAFKNYISKQDGFVNNTVTTPSNTAYFKIIIFGTTYNNNVSVNYPSTDHDYHAYTGNTYRVEIGQKNKLPMTVDGIKSANTSGTWNWNAYTVNGVTSTILTDSDGNVTEIKVDGTITTTLTFKLCANSGFLPMGDYILTDGAQNPSNSINVTIYKNNTWIGSTTNNGSLSFSSAGATDTFYAEIYINSNAGTLTSYNFKPMIRTTIDDSEFVPYNPNLPDAIYGGELDVITGKMRVDRGCATYDGSNDEGWALSGNGYRVNISDLASVIKKPSSGSATDMFLISSQFKQVSANSTYMGYQGISVDSDVGTLSVHMGSDQAVMTVADWKAYLASNPLQVVYELAEPYTIQLTPQQIRLLKGTNNISCNTGDLSIKYYPDNVLGQLKGDIESEYDERVETLETQVQELQPSLIFMSRERRDITSDLSRLPIAVAEQNLEKYGYKIGDYFERVDGNRTYTYHIADYNTFKGTSTPYCLTINHIGIVVDTHSTSQWYSGDASAVGYNGSTLHTYLKGTVLDNIKADMIYFFGGTTGLEHLLSHRKLLTTALANWGWQVNQYISALTCTQIDAGSQWTANGFQEGEANKSLELFRKHKWTEIFESRYPWLRNLSNYSGGSVACYANVTGALDGLGSVTGARFVVGLIIFH